MKNQPGFIHKHRYFISAYLIWFVGNIYYWMSADSLYDTNNFWDFSTRNISLHTSPFLVPLVAYIIWQVLKNDIQKPKKAKKD